MNDNADQEHNEAEEEFNIGDHMTANSILDELDVIASACERDTFNRHKQMSVNGENSVRVDYKQTYSAEDLFRQFFLPVFGKAVDQLIDKTDDSEMSVHDFLEELHKHVEEGYVRILKETEAKPEDIVKIDRAKAEELFYPVDKINSNWMGIEAPEDSDVYDREFSTLTKRDAHVNLIADFSQLPETVHKKLTAYDKTIYLVIGALYTAGNRNISFRSIYKTMGNEGSPNEENLKRIYKSVLKMKRIFIRLDNKREYEITNGKYEYLSIEEDLLPVKIITKREAGEPGEDDKITDLVIVINNELPLMQFARVRHQISKFPMKALKAPASMTDKNGELLHYLLLTIGRRRNEFKAAKKKTGRFRMKWSTIYQKCGVKPGGKYGSRNIQRIQDFTKKYLEHYKDCGIINGFKVGEDAITITVSTKDDDSNDE